MLIERPHKLFRLFYKGAIWQINTDEKVIYLTFDDGPTPEVTTKVLDILDAYNIKASFFCIGQNVINYPEIYQLLISKGHTVGNHTHSHLKGFEVSNEEYFANVKEASKYIHSQYFRPPYGRIKRSQLRALQKDYTVVLWDLITRDYNANLSNEYILRNIKRLKRNGSIVVFHDSKKAEKRLLAVLPEAIKYWIQQGYTFKKL
ncbi:MAG: polysaccharide deacetylase family protein [Paludibacteraceae bacterium]|nr:polysaccharide deacetylase family protein [Paludibacteraceae bacterium]MBN2786728.1 polysaccharide deacetylase family protein [Paludibacteraceae bacterium]